MNIEPFDWSVVIIGYWNRAILTPNGIANRLFKLEKGAGIEVFIPVDLVDSPLVKHDGITVKVEDRQLIVGTEDPGYVALEKAMKIGQTALTGLPETPVLAAGFNIRYKTADLGVGLDELTRSDLDDRLSDAGYQIVYRGLIRRLHVKKGALEKGVVTLSTHKDDGRARIELNFHRDSKNVQELVEWLRIQVSDVKDAVDQILLTLSSTDIGEPKHE